MTGGPALLLVLLVGCPGCRFVGVMVGANLSSHAAHRAARHGQPRITATTSLPAPSLVRRRTGSSLSLSLSLSCDVPPSCWRATPRLPPSRSSSTPPPRLDGASGGEGAGEGQEDSGVGWSSEAGGPDGGRLTGWRRGRR
ncbi:hypothetical protein VPH35_036918 [Triticum aestivum]